MIAQLLVNEKRRSVTRDLLRARHVFHAYLAIQQGVLRQVNRPDAVRGQRGWSPGTSLRVAPGVSGIMEIREAPFSTRDHDWRSAWGACSHSLAQIQIQGGPQSPGAAVRPPGRRDLRVYAWARTPSVPRTRSFRRRASVCAVSSSSSTSASGSVRASANTSVSPGSRTTGGL